MTVTGALVTVTVTFEEHESPDMTTRSFPPFEASPPLGVSPSLKPLPPFGAAPDGNGSRMTTRVDVMVEMIVVVGSSGVPVAPIAPFSVTMVGAGVA